MKRLSLRKKCIYELLEETGLKKSMILTELRWKVFQRERIVKAQLFNDLRPNSRYNKSFNRTLKSMSDELEIYSFQENNIPSSGICSNEILYELLDLGIISNISDRHKLSFYFYKVHHNNHNFGQYKQVIRGFCDCAVVYESENISILIHFTPIHFRRFSIVSLNEISKNQFFQLSKSECNHYYINEEESKVISAFNPIPLEKLHYIEKTRYSNINKGLTIWGRYPQNRFF